MSMAVAVLSSTAVAYAQMGDFYKPREPEQIKTISITPEFEEDDNMTNALSELKINDRWLD